MRKGFRIIKFKKNKPIFQIKDVSKSFDGRPILKKINIEIFPGEIVGVLDYHKLLKLGTSCL